MNKKSGMAKIWILTIVVIVILVVIATVIGVILVLKKSNNKPVEIYTEPIDIYNENREFSEEVVDDGDSDELEPLDSSLVEFRNYEYGVRFGYLKGMNLPIDNIDNDNFFHSNIKKGDSTKNIELVVGGLENLYEKEEYVNKKIEELRQTAKDISISYGLLSGQMSIKIKYSVGDVKYYQNLTIKEKVVYMLTYSANTKEYNESEANKIFESFSFIESYMNYPVTAERKIKIDGEEYALPVKISNIKGLSINPKYSNEILNPNYFSIVSLYEVKDIKYSAYVYNAKASQAQVNTGYMIGIETDKFRGGDLEIIGGIKLGTLRSEVKNILGLPRNEYKTESDTVLVNTYIVNDATIELKYKTSDGSPVDDSTPVYGINIRVKR